MNQIFLTCDGFFSNLSMIAFYQDDNGLFLENNNTYLFLNKIKIGSSEPI